MSAWDMGHGAARSNHDIYNAIWAAFGPLFRGGVFHEGNTTGWSKLYRPDWWGQAIQFAPYDAFMQQYHAEAFVAWCAAHRDASGAPRRVLWSEPVWSTMGNPQKVLTDGEQMLRNLASAYPGVISPGFADNVSPTSPPDFYRWLWPMMTAGTVSWMASLQSYLKKLAQTVTDAVRVIHDGAQFALFEPAWTWFNLPAGFAGNGLPYSLANSGTATPALLSMIPRLLIA